jgi:hypothetical protein
MSLHRDARMRSLIRGSVVLIRFTSTYGDAPASQNDKRPAALPSGRGNSTTNDLVGCFF